MTASGIDEAPRSTSSTCRFLFTAHAAGELQLAVTTITMAEVLAGPLRSGDEALAKRYRAVLTSWHVVDLTAEIAETAARFRATLDLKLPDAVQAASAVTINAHALVTHDRDFSRLTSLRVMSQPNLRNLDQDFASF